jgi:hypothetical protein
MYHLDQQIRALEKAIAFVASTSPLLCGSLARTTVISI